MNLTHEKERALKEALEGLQEAIQDVLMSRGLPLDEPLRSTIARCQDRERLRTWLRRAATASSSAEIFE